MKLIWRNIWRNRRRAIITMASIFFAVFFCTIMNSVVSGLWEKMRDDALRTQTGHIQIHQSGYWNDKIMDNFMYMEDTVMAKLESLDNIENLSPRLETFAMASYGTLSKGIALMGISPEKEKQKSNLPIRLTKGDYLTETDDGILIGEGLANYLKVDVGDTIALIGQGYHGASAAGLFPVRGLLKLPLIEMDYGLAYMTLLSAQNFIDMPNGYSGILIAIKNEKMLYTMMEDIRSQLSENYEVLPWTVTMKELLQTSASHKGMVSMIMLVLYLIVGFGILGTVIMMTNERKREFSMMISLGLSRRRLKVITVLELTLLTLTGVLLATAVTIPVTFFFSVHPIQLTGDLAQSYIELGMEPVMPTIVDAKIFITQSLTILFFACLTFIYPIRKITKLMISNK